MKHKLKSCPFCGHEAGMNYDVSTNCYYAFCTFCNARMDGYYVYFRQRDGSFDNTKKLLIADWNRREIIHSKWELHKDGSGTCRQCGVTQKNVWDYDNWQNYCGHCGAKMDLE